MSHLVVVTLRSGHYSKDFELPANLLLYKLYPQVLEALKMDAPAAFQAFSTIVFERNGEGLLDETATLSDYGVCTGTYLDVVSKDKYRKFVTNRAN